MSQDLHPSESAADQASRNSYLAFGIQCSKLEGQWREWASQDRRVPFVGEFEAWFLAAWRLSGGSSTWSTKLARLLTGEIRAEDQLPEGLHRSLVRPYALGQEQKDPLAPRAMNVGLVAVLRLRLWAERSFEEIAELLGLASDGKLARALYEEALDEMSERIKNTPPPDDAPPGAAD